MSKKHILEIGLFVLVGVIFFAGGLGMFLGKLPVSKNIESQNHNPNTISVIVNSRQSDSVYKNFFESKQDFGQLTDVEKQLALKVPYENSGIIPHSVIFGKINDDENDDAVGFLGFSEDSDLNTFDRLQLTVWLKNSTGEYVLQDPGYEDLSIYLSKEEKPDICSIEIPKNGIIKVACDRSAQKLFDPKQVTYLTVDSSGGFHKAHEYDKQLWNVPNTSTWSTYENKDLGVILKTPSGWIIQSYSPTWLDFTKTTNARSIVVEKNNVAITIFGIPDISNSRGGEVLDISSFYKTIFNSNELPLVRQDGVFSDLGDGYPSEYSHISTYRFAIFDLKNQYRVFDSIDQGSQRKNGIRYIMFITAPKTLKGSTIDSLLAEANSIMSTLSFVVPNGSLSKAVDMEERMSSWKKISIPEYNFSFYAPSGYVESSVLSKNVLWSKKYTRTDSIKTDYFFNPQIDVSVLPYTDLDFKNVYKTAGFNSKNKTCTFTSEYGGTLQEKAPRKFANVEVCEDGSGDAGYSRSTYYVIDPDQKYIVKLSLNKGPFSYYGDSEMIANTMKWEK